MRQVKRILSTGSVLAIGAFALIPSIGMALSTGFDSTPVSLSARGGIGSFTPASVDPRLAADLQFKALGTHSKFRFTPATEAGSTPRSVTVAVRVNPEGAKAVNIRPQVAITGGGKDAGGSAAPVRITQSAYNLGVAKGWQKFALPKEIRDINAPDIGTIAGRAEPRVTKKPSRFRADVEMDTVQQPGSAARNLTNETGYLVDVGGSYKLTRNLNVTAGVRLRSERDRLTPLTNEQQDSQAVYVGTQFRF